MQQRFPFFASMLALLVTVAPCLAAGAGPGTTQTPAGRQGMLPAKHGTLILRTLPVVTEIEIPELGLNQRKDKEIWKIEAIAAGEYDVRVFAGGKNLSHRVKIVENSTTSLFFDVLSGNVEDMDAPPPPQALSTTEDFVHVEGGCFLMGDIFGNGQDDEQPVHEVCVDDFRIGRYEVAQAQWEEVMGNNPSRSQKGGRYPVENVSWDEVREFIKRLNGKTGRFHRLPTEAEWEYACRSGGREEAYCGGQELDRYAWHRENSARQIRPVGQKQPNGLGIHDMSGNVWEWCQDSYGEDYYRTTPRNNPRGPFSGPYRVIRGGSWSFPALDARAANRDRRNPAYGFDALGFRLVLPPQQR